VLYESGAGLKAGFGWVWSAQRYHKTLPKIEWAGSGMTKNYDQRGIPPRSRARKALPRLTSLRRLEIWR